jgi:peptidoglycan/LPS O-acetylase OafA/YrhL
MMRAEKPSLTGLRGVAAVAAAVFHFKIDSAFFALDRSQDRFGRLVGDVIDRGYLAVDLFFVLSGFVMALCYAPMFNGRFELRTYRAALLLRLAPPVAGALTAIAAALIIILLTLPGTDVALVLLFSVLILGLSHEQGWIARTLGGPRLHGLGVLSYVIYLLHFRFIWLERVTRDHPPATLSANSRQAIALAFVFALLLAASFCAYTVMEKLGR